MALTQEQSDALVQKLEKFSKTHPQSYRLRVALLAMLGYAYIFFVLAGLLTLFGLLIALIIFSHRISSLMVKFAILLLIPGWLILRSLWVTLHPPQGLKLRRQEVPQLFALVDDVTTQLQAPRFHNILLNEEFNAQIMQVPKLGILGWQENYLVLGLPLMQALSLEQLTAVLAHEVGHLSGNHSRFGAWIYRIRKTWMQLSERLYQSNQLTVWIVFKIFFGWYWPYFNAYSFNLARMNEYEADRCAAQLTGANNIAEALINLKIKNRLLLTCFWPDIQKQVEHQADPPDNTYSSMLTVLQHSIPHEEAKHWLEQALAEKTSYADTHPCLCDRLKSLGYESTEPEILLQSATISKSAAEHLLGQSINQFATHFDQTWQADKATPWRQHYAYLQEAKAKLQALDKKAQVQTLTEQEAWERASYTLELQGDEAALPLLQEVLKIQPNHPKANYIIGEVFLRKADASGVDHIEKAIAQRPDWVIDGCASIYAFFCQQGQTEEAQKYHNRAEQHHQLLLKAEEERASVRDHDEFKPHTLNASEVHKLKQDLAAYPQIQEAYLVEKVVKYFPEERFTVLGILRKRSFLEGQDANQNLMDLLITNLRFPTQSYIIILNNGRSGKLKKKICRVDRSLIFKR